MAGKPADVLVIACNCHCIMSKCVCSGVLHERLSKYHVMLEEQQGTNYRLTGELAAKERHILRLKQALDQRKSGPKG